MKTVPAAKLSQEGCDIIVNAAIEKAKELLHYARTQGYKPDELIRIIQQLG